MSCNNQATLQNIDSVTLKGNCLCNIGFYFVKLNDNPAYTRPASECLGCDFTCKTCSGASNTCITQIF